jgi:formate hydrogenlyase subunit 3/multisubunit Na+/H+ antiporter MnhD subunit
MTPPAPETAVVAAILLCVAGAGATWLLARWRVAAGWVAFAVTAATALLVYGAVLHVLRAGPGPGATFLSLPRFGFALRIYVDGLSAVFLGLAATIAVPASLYSIPYLTHYPEESVGRYYPPFLLFLAAMYGLVSTTDMMWFFFIFWQMMTLPGYALIRFESRKPAHVRAANQYLVMMQIACAATMLGAELLTLGGAAATGAAAPLKYDFDSISARLPALLQHRSGLATVAFALFLVGFGIKMGMWPFGQVWLPDAHPAAPSPVSALLSGVMIKTGVYGLIRYFLWLVPAEARALFPLGGWGLLLGVLGTLTLFIGTMQALKQEQSKRLLAFHSIGQMGYILLGVGACLALLAPAEPTTAPFAAVALFAALFHIVNHGLFKALLFLNAGSILYATGTQDLNRLGGLARCMPWTAVTALVASFSISGVPLFNGFASKWSLYVATILGSAAVPWLVAGALVAILTSALTLASFVKFYGASFLSRTSRLVQEQTARTPSIEVGPLMQVSQALLAVLCLTLGVFPALAGQAMQGVLASSRQGLGGTLAAVFPDASGSVVRLSMPQAQALWTPLVMAVVLALMFGAAYGLARLGGSARRRAPPWLCGYVLETDANRYTAHGFYGEVKRYFGWLGGRSRPQPPSAGPEHRT